MNKKLVLLGGVVIVLVVVLILYFISRPETPQDIVIVDETGSNVDR